MAYVIYSWRRKKKKKKKRKVENFRSIWFIKSRNSL